MEIANSNINTLIENKRTAWDRLYDARQWRVDHEDTTIFAHRAYYAITNTSNSEWVPQDIQDKIEEVNEYFKNYFNNFNDEIKKLKSTYNQIIEDEKTACKDYKHCFIINITLHDWDSHTNKDYCIWFVAKNKKAYKKELHEALESLKTTIEELKSSNKIDSYYLKPYSIESYESIKTFKTSKLSVENMLFILDEIKTSK